MMRVSRRDYTTNVVVASQHSIVKNIKAGWGFHSSW